MEDNMFIKRIIGLALILAICPFCFSQEYEPVPLQLNMLSEAWYARDFIKLRESDLSLEKNVILGINALHGSPDGSQDNVYMNTVLFENKKYFVYANNTSPLKADAIFPEEWLSSLVGWERKIWIMSYMLDILKSGDRNTFIKYEKEYIDALNASMIYDEYFDGWWRYRPIADCLIITQSAISIGAFNNIGLWVVNNQKIEEGYRVTLQGDANFMEIEKEETTYLKIHFPIPSYSQKKIFNLLLIRDHDYMDIYLEDTSNKLGTFVLVEPVFLKQLNKLLSENMVDKKLIITWPRRADGSMDYPPPTDMSKYSATHKTLDNLRMRDNSNTTSLLVTTLQKDTDVQVLETGTNTTIDGITAPWVKILSSTGYTGWCFSGYLEELPNAEVSIQTEAALSENAVAPVSQDRAIPVFLIVGGIGVLGIAGGVVFLLLRKHSG
jgi:hypothetical protein